MLGMFGHQSIASRRCSHDGTAGRREITLRRSPALHGSMFAIAALAAMALVAVSSAHAGPRFERVAVRYGIVAELAGAGCTTASFVRSTAGEDPVRFEPAVGEDVGDFDSVVVTDAALADGRGSWTVQPTAEECAYHEGDPSWTWSTGDRSWAVTHRTSARTIRASRHRGIRSIGGFRVNRRSRAKAPTIKRARRHFGRPSSLRRRYRVACRARWDRIGLTIDLLNLGGRNPCRHGFVQAGRVSGRHASDWTGVVAKAPGVALGTTDEFFEDAFIGEPGETRRLWTLADVFIPYGDGGYAPSLSARLGRRGAVRGFEFWVAAGGD